MSAPSSSPSRPTILLVDDEANVTAALIRHFPQRDYEVFTAMAAAGAYELLSRRTIDVIISDERMPGESGTEFLSNVRRLYPGTIRIVLSGQASMDAAIRAINKAEAYRFFLKPCNPQDLLISVKQSLDERRLRQSSPVPSTIDRSPPLTAGSREFRIGDRVTRRNAPADGSGTVTQVLAQGVVRVLWDFSAPSSMHTFDSLRLLTD